MFLNFQLKSSQMWALLLIFMCSCAVHSNPIASRNDSLTEFIILHNNDMHAKFEQTNSKGGVCSPSDAGKNKCYGGFARVAHEVRRHREEAKNGGMPVLYLNAGDTYSGTVWYKIFKDNITSAFLNKLQPDAMSLGNHEFEDGSKGLVPFLNAVDFPVLVSNLDLSQDTELTATNRISNSTILAVDGAKVGIIGYLTPKTKEDSATSVEFKEEISSINTEAAKLKSQGIEIIIALGHSGYQKDQEIAKNCPEVDIVIGGHSHTFLDSSQPVADKDDTNPEAVRGPYPTIVVQPSGKKVPVVQAYAHTKYLGKLHVQFDAAGNLIQNDGSPILLDASVTQEQDILDLLEVYRPNITTLGDKIVGYTKVDLEGGRVCRRKECNLGNLIADSMVNARVVENKGGEFWTDAAIALIMSGGIRTSINKNAEGSITLRDLTDIMPYGNLLYLTRIKGKTLRNALEHSASVKNTDSDGGFLQFSGLRVKYDFNMENGNRVISILVRCAQCNVPSYSNLNETQFYNVIVPKFFIDGGDGYTLVEKDEPFTELLQKDDVGALELYLKEHQFVYPEVDGRIGIRKSTG
ncbi:hypothetical protein KR222_007239 [Zaprionus bogoriensis]|nr:hypothetical protein KR222_007239 [Zaprionus bogoriensis]